MALSITLGAQAQSSTELEKVAFARDSVADLLAEHRTNYARNENLREQLAPTILSLEGELVRLQGEYDKVLKAIANNDAKEALLAYEQARKEAETAKKEQQPTVEESKKSVYTPDKTRMKRDLVANDYFAERLSEADYTSLRAARSED